MCRPSFLQVKTILLLCENIEHIFITTDSYASNLITRAITEIATANSHDGKQFKLKYINRLHWTLDDGPRWTSTRPTLKELKSVVQMCPFIQEIYLHNNAFPENYLVTLNDLQHLRGLTLKKFNFYANKVSEVFKVSGCNLTELCISDDIQIDLNALMCINQMCPNLERLTLQNIERATHGLLPAMVVQNAPFKRLKHLSLYTFQISDKE